MTSSLAIMCLPSASAKKPTGCGFCLPVLSPTRITTLLMPSTGVFQIACTCQILFSSKPQLACKNAFTVSLVGDAAVKLSGSGLGNTGAADGAGADGSSAGAGGTCCWPKTFKAGTEMRASAAKLAKRADRRINRILLVWRENSHVLAYTCTLTAMGNLRPMPNDFEVTFSTGAACWRLYSERSTRRTTCWTSSRGNPCASAMCSGVS